jgi:hypothetical protein
MQRAAYQRQCAGGRAKARAAVVVAAQGWVRGAWPTGHLVIRTCSAFPLRSALALSSPCFSCFFLISPAWMVEYCGEQAGAAGRGAGELPTTQVGGARELGGIAGRQQATGSAARTFHAYLRSSSSEASAGASSAIVQCVACAPGFVRGRGGGRSYVRFSQALVCGSRGGGAREAIQHGLSCHTGAGQCSQLHAVQGKMRGRKRRPVWPGLGALGWYVRGLGAAQSPAEAQSVGAGTINAAAARRSCCCCWWAPYPPASQCAAAAAVRGRPGCTPGRSPAQRTCWPRHRWAAAAR